MELKPCPFCGGAAHIEKHTCINKLTYYTVHCNFRNQCGAKNLKHYKSEEDATKAWNRRCPDA